MKKLFALLVLLAIVFGVAAMAEETFKVGAYFGLTGAQSVYGNEALNSIKLGAEYINQNGGFNGVPVEIVSYDTQSSPEEAIKIVNKLMDQDHVGACIGSMNSGEVLATAGFLNDAGVYTIGCGTSPSWMAKDWPYVFRASMNNDFGAAVQVQMATELGAQTVAYMYGQDDSSTATFNTLKALGEAAGLKSVTEQSYDATDNDFSAQIAKIVSKNPDVVILAISGDAMPVIIKQMRQLGYNGVLVHKECVSSATLDITGVDNATFVCFPTPYVTYTTVEECDIPVMKDFLQRYQDAYGVVPSTDSSYRGWDSIMVMWEASKIAGSNDSTALRDATHTISGLSGLGGTLDYTSGNREGYNKLNAFIYVDGQNILFDDWMQNGGFEAYKARTGRQH